MGWFSPFQSGMMTSWSCPRGLPLRHFRLNNHPVGQENDEKHSFDWSFDRVLENRKTTWHWSFPNSWVSIAPICTWKNGLPSLPRISAAFSSLTVLARSVRQSRTRIRIFDHRQDDTGIGTAQPPAPNTATNGRLVRTTNTLVKKSGFQWKNPFARCAAK